MSVSDQSGEPKPIQPIKPKRILRPLTDHQWALLRIQYEQGGDEISYTKLSAEHGVSYSTLTKRAADEGWTKTKDLVVKAGQLLAKKTDEKLAAAVDEAAAIVSRQITKELQPWIEAEKRAHIKRAIKRSKKALKRIDDLTDGYFIEEPKTGEPVEIKPGPKDEMMIANAEDKYDNIIRRNLGMSDSSGISGNLNVQVLAGQAAVAVTQS